MTGFIISIHFLIQKVSQTLQMKNIFLCLFIMKILITVPVITSQIGIMKTSYLDYLTTIRGPNDMKWHRKRQETTRKRHFSLFLYSNHLLKAPETDLTSDACVKQLCSIAGWEQYKKAVLTIKQQDSLWDNRMTAVPNMKDKTESNKTYSTIYQFINILEEEKKQ